MSSARWTPRSTASGRTTPRAAWPSSSTASTAATIWRPCPPGCWRRPWGRRRCRAAWRRSGASGPPRRGRAAARADSAPSWAGPRRRGRRPAPWWRQSGARHRWSTHGAWPRPWRSVGGGCAGRASTQFSELGRSAHDHGENRISEHHLGCRLCVIRYISGGRNDSQVMMDDLFSSLATAIRTCEFEYEYVNSNGQLCPSCATHNYTPFSVLIRSGLVKKQRMITQRDRDGCEYSAESLVFLVEYQERCFAIAPCQVIK